MGQALPGQRAERPAAPAREARGHAGSDDPLRSEDRPGPADPGALGARPVAADEPRPADRPGPSGRPAGLPAGRAPDGPARPAATARNRTGTVNQLHRRGAAPAPLHPRDTVIRTLPDAVERGTGNDHMPDVFTSSRASRPPDGPVASLLLDLLRHQSACVGVYASDGTCLAASAS